jgi:hypothetical protein
MGPIYRASVSEATVFIFTGHRHMTDKLLNTEYGYNPFKQQQGSHVKGIPKTTLSYSEVVGRRV